MNRVLPGAYSLTRRAKTALRTHFETKGLDWMQVTPEEILTALPRIALLTGVGVVTVAEIDDWARSMAQTTPAVERARKLLQDKGYLVVHKGLTED
jgi:hypothetical protein